MRERHLFTSESVSEGHPDKLADQISDAVLDLYLGQDPEAKVACECLLTKDHVIIAGEIHSEAKLHDQIQGLVGKVIEDVGYNASNGYDPDNLRITVHVQEQSAEIRAGVDIGGAGDQGLMFGYACNETPELMPYAIHLAHRIMERQALLRRQKTFPWLLPDAKSQVTVIYENEQLTGIDNILVSTQHAPFTHNGWHRTGDDMPPHQNLSNEMIRDTVISSIIKPLISQWNGQNQISYLVNPSGSFTSGGPATDTGLTGRKIIVDTYGGACPHGGGAFSGKDPSKVDRSAAYMARYLAKNIVASGVAEKCLVQLSYAIGKAEPLSFMLDFMGTGKVRESAVQQYLEKKVDLTPGGIIEILRLKRPIYRQTSAYGHFGRELPDFTWEKTDLAKEIAKV